MRTQPAAGRPSGSSAPDSAASTGVAAANGTFPATAAPPNGAPAPAPPASGSGNGAGTPGRRTGLRRGALALAALAGKIPGMLRTHWLASILIAGGVVLRALAQMAYHPAIIYIDTLKYLYDAWPGSDPVGYKVPLKLILAVGDLGTVELVQHLLGIAIAVTLYTVMIRRGVPRWLGAIAIAPVLFDAYQVQVEAMIMPDIWFEALVVAGLAVLLWRPMPGMRLALIGGALLGASTGVRQVGEVLVIPALIFVLAMGGGWRKVVQNATAVVCGFSLALLFYLSADFQLAGHFWISRSSVSLTYGRMSSVADCATLKLPKVEQPLCPTKKQQAMGPDWLDHGYYSPLRTYDEAIPVDLLGEKGQLVANFNQSVERQQPLRVISGILHDSVKLFAVSRRTSPGDTPIVRWQFQRHFPTVQYGPWISVRNNAIWLDLGSLESSTLQELNPAYGGAPQVDRPIAAFLRSYQVRGGYTPGPLFALSLVAGLAGSVLAFGRRRRGAAARPGAARVAAARQAAIACLFFFTTGVFVLGVSDLFEFTWRYEIPAIVTLPPAGALGIGALIIAARKPRDPVAADAVSGRAPEMAAPAP
ncbi:MAG TPA: hypothetical protein VEM58_16010 [Streptosporangiaceae bacterium]|nr:hypothetical protein [Streptosporangiaceae bacterium]